MIVIAVSSWRKKLIILLCVILLAATFSIALNYYRTSTVDGEIELYEEVVKEQEQ